MKRTMCVVLMLALIFVFASCGHEHEWQNPTYENPKICSGCGEQTGLSIKEMLLGEWCESGSSNIYLGVWFTNDGFTADIVMNGSASNGAFATEGTVEVSGNKITLFQTNGKTYIYYTYVIHEDTIALTDYEGKTWVKANQD